MKLRNKKTGEIIEWEHGPQYKLGKEYSSIKEFAEDWEDAPEPKKKYYIGNSGVIHIEGTNLNREAREVIGNSFGSWLEAYEALGKLRAWKRLKDKGFRFKTFYVEDREIVIRGGSDTASSIEMWEYLDTLFGGDQ